MHICTLQNTTEKGVDIQVVDKNLPNSQRIIDSRLTGFDPRDANAPLRDEARNDDEPCYWLEMNLQDCRVYTYTQVTTGHNRTITRCYINGSSK